MKPKHGYDHQEYPETVTTIPTNFSMNEEDVDQVLAPLLKDLAETVETYLPDIKVTYEVEPDSNGVLRIVFSNK